MKRQIGQFFIAAMMSAAIVSAQGQGPFDTGNGSRDSAQNSADAIGRRV